MAGVREARALAEALHREQVDKAGKPYVGHLERVVAHLVALGGASEDEIVAAWLHDALEDTSATASLLIEAGFSAGAVEIIVLVSKEPGREETYAERIERLIASRNRSAIRVKLADNKDNGDPERLALLGEKQARTLAKRYEATRIRLEAALVALDEMGA